VQVSSGNGITVQYGERKVVLDPYTTPASADIVFVSHAHIDHMHSSTGQSPTLASRETTVLAKARGFNLGQTREELEGIELYDSGHIVGSRGVLIEGQVFYTGDIAGRARAFLGKGVAPKCSILIIESTYGRSEFRFPSVARVLEEVNHLISNLFDRGIPVILMGYPLGKAQILSYLFSNWEPIYLHSSVEKMNRVCSELGVEIRGDFRSYSEANEKGLMNKRPWVLISPVQSARSDFVKGLKKRYGAVTVSFTGWSVEDRYKYAMGVDYSFPLSDHCDFLDLVNLVRRCEPERVYTVHGFCAEFAAYLKRMGFHATPLLGIQRSMTDYIEAD